MGWALGFAVRFIGQRLIIAALSHLGKVGIVCKKKNWFEISDPPEGSVLKEKVYAEEEWQRNVQHT